MADPKILIVGEDRTQAAVRSVVGGLNTIAARAQSLSGAFAPLSALSGIAGPVGVATAAIGAALGGLVGHATKLGSELADLSQRTGISAETLSSYKLAADLSGTSLDSLARGLKTLSTTLAESRNESSEAAKILRAIGVSAVDASGNLRGLSPALEDVAEVFQALPDGAGAEKTALAIKLFGKSGQELIPFLNEGKSGLAELRKEAEKLGLVMSDDAAKSADKLGDEIDKLKASASGLAVTLGGPLIKELNRVIEEIKAASNSADGFWLSFLKAPFQSEIPKATDEVSKLRAEIEKLEKLRAEVRTKDTAASLQFDGSKVSGGSTSAEAAKLDERIKQLRAQADALQGSSKADEAAAKANAARIQENLKLLFSQQIGTIVSAQQKLTDALKTEFGKTLEEARALREKASQFTAGAARIRAAGAASAEDRKLSTLTPEEQDAVRVRSVNDLLAQSQFASARATLAAQSGNAAAVEAQAKKAADLAELAEQTAQKLSDPDLAARFIASAVEARAQLQEQQAQIAEQQAKELETKAQGQAALIRGLEEDMKRLQAAAKFEIDIDDTAARAKIKALIDAWSGALNLGSAATPPSAATPELASGGPIRGPGGPRDDKVLLWGSNGEYMQPARATAHYGMAFMDAVRTLRFPKYADGGPISRMRMPQMASAAGGAFSSPVTLDFSSLGLGRVEMRAQQESTDALVRLFQREALRVGR